MSSPSSWKSRLSAQARRGGELEGELVLDVERLGAGRLVARIQRDLLDLGLRLAQQRVAMGFQRLAPLIDQDRRLKLHVALFQAIDDGFELLQRLLEAQILDVGMLCCVGHAEPLALCGGRVQEEGPAFSKIKSLVLPTLPKSVIDPKGIL